MNSERIVRILEQPKIGTQIQVKGWVRTRRDSKEFSFLELNDGSCLRNLQIVAPASLSNYESEVLHMHTGAAIGVEGELVQSPGKGQAVEVRATKMTLIGPCSAEEYPLQKKRHTNEYLRTIAHLRPRTNTFGAVFRVRSMAALAIHEFFRDRGFVYVHTPIISASDCEGAGNLFRVTTLDLNKLPMLANDRGEQHVDMSQDFFGRDTYLTVSGQLQGEIFASSLGSIYTFGPTFRAENSNTPRHLAEFWMIEPEVAFCDLRGNMELAEAFTRSVIQTVLTRCAEDIAFFDKWVEPGIAASLQSVADASFEHLTYTDAIAALEKSQKTFEFPVKWGCDLQTEHERYLTEEYIKKPVFITNYPKEIKSFYMKLDPGERTVSAMDLLVPRLGEIIGGSQREEQEDILRRRMKECGLKEEDYWWYLELRKFGSVPHSGFGLGFERLVMYMTGISNIRDVVPFARAPKTADF